MSDTTEDLLARFEAVVARLEELGGPGISLAAATNPDGTPANVAAGELIESAWGNAVADTIERLKIPNAIAGDGDPIGNLQIGTGQVATVLDANGNVLVPFPASFVSLVSVVVSNSKYPSVHVPSAVSITLSNFTLHVRNMDTGAPAASEACQVGWVAIGRR